MEYKLKFKEITETILTHFIMLIFATIAGGFMFMLVIGLGTQLNGWKLWITLPIMIGAFYYFLYSFDKENYEVK